MRVIALPTEATEAQSAFGILLTAAFQGEGAKSHADARTLSKLQDVLEAVSHAEGEGRALNEGVTEIRLDDAYCEMLKARIFGAGIPWLAAASRRVVAAYELVANAADEKPAKPEAVA